MIKYMYIFVFTCLLIPNSLQVIHNAIHKYRNHNNIIENKIVEYLQEGHRELGIIGLRESVFMLGLAGTGKTTNALVLAADNSKLISKDIGEEVGTPLGVYYIADETGSLGNSQVHQKNIIGNVLYDRHNGISYYDLPAYDHTRDVNVDVTSVYFVKEIVELSNYVKFILNIDHDSVTIGGSRTKFLFLLEQVSRFIMDIEKYRDAIGMVITKVNMPPLSDDNIIAAIAMFLEHTKTELQKNINEKPFYENAIKIINILLQKTNNKYERMSLLRTPDRAGPVSEIPVIQDSRNKIINMINTHMKYVKKSDDDFNYIISVNTQNNMVMINKIMNDEVYKNLKETNEEFEKHFTHIRNDNSISNEQKKIMFTDSLMIINNFINNAPHLNTADKFMKKLSETTAILKIEIPNEIKIKLINNMDFLNFLHRVSYIEIRIDAVEWVSSFQGTVQFLEDALNTLSRQITTLRKV